MRFPIVPRRRHEQELAAAKTEADRLRERAEKAEGIARSEVAARRTITAQYCALSDEHDLVVSRNTSLSAQLDELKDAAGAVALARRQADRIAELLEEAARAREEIADAHRQAAHLQKQLDDAFSLDDPKVAAGERWQDRREDKKAVTS